MPNLLYGFESSWELVVSFKIQIRKRALANINNLKKYARKNGTKYRLIIAKN